MVSPQALALVVRQRGGPNLIVHTRGIPGSVAGRACEEAVTVMGKFAAGRGKGDLDGSGDNPPTFGFDKLVVGQGRYVVVYRLVNKVWVMAVSLVHSNLFVSVRVVESATNGLVTACQTMEITADTVTKHYAESYLMMGAVLNHQGASFGKSQLEALANLYSLAAEGKGGRKAPEPQRVSGREGHKKKLASVSDVKQKMTFSMPRDPAQDHPPASVSPRTQKSKPPEFQPAPQNDQSQFDVEGLGEFLEFAKAKKEAEQQQEQGGFQGLDDFFSSVTEGQGQTSQNTVFDAAFPPISSPAISSQPATSSQMPWEDFSLQPKLEQKLPEGMDDWWTAPTSMSTQPAITQATPAPAPPPIPPLLLVETLCAEFSSTSLDKCHVIGTVKLASKAHTAYNTQFRLAKPDRGGVENMLRSAQVARGLKGGLEKGVFELVGAGNVGFDGGFLKYKLLPGMFDAPLMLRLTAGVQQGGAGKFMGQEGVVVAVIEYVVRPGLEGWSQGFVDLHVPEKLGTPSSVRPKPEWSAQSRKLRWKISVESGKCGVMRVVFPPETGMDSLSAIGVVGGNREASAQSLRAEAHLVGKGGSTLSGTSLYQGNGTLSHTPTSCIWSAHISARP